MPLQLDWPHGREAAQLWGINDNRTVTQRLTELEEYVMASTSSTSSDENLKAPNLNLHVSSSSDDVGEVASVRATAPAAPHLRCRCPLCGRGQHPQRFHCSLCVRNGNIVHSAAASPKKESLSEKQQNYLKIQTNLKDLSNHYERRIREHRLTENLQFEVKQKKEQLEVLKQLVESKRARLVSLAEQRNKLHKANAEKRKQLPNYPIKVKGLENYVLDRNEKIGGLREKHNERMIKLQNLTRRNIHQLVQYIFPITEIVLENEPRRKVADNAPAIAAPDATCDAPEGSETETIAALADAKNTSYIRGKWVFHGSGISEVQYRIVDPSLPANGDYTAYIDWLTDNKDDVPKNATPDIAPSRVSAFRIAAALTYTTQLTHILSYYLNVRLPYKLAYGDFCKKLNEEQFIRKVTRLNSNIMYLAYTQKVRLRDLNENHTLENVLAILDVEKSDLGRHGFHEVSNAPLMKSVDSLLIGIETATESESEEENSLRLDWESVPNFPPPQDINEPSLEDNAVGQQSTIKPGLMTSTANRLRQWWKR